MKPTLILLMLLATTSALAANYKWVDARGSVHYTDQPPPSGVSATAIPTTSQEGNAVLVEKKTEPKAAKKTEAQKKLEDVALVPYVDKYGRDTYRNFLQKPLPRAFVLCEDGTAMIFTGPNDTNLAQQTEKFIADNKNRVCKPYAINEEVVW